MNNSIKLAFALTILAGCGDAPLPSDDASAGKDDAPAASMYELAVASPDRTDADRERDAGRMPAKVLEFFGIGRGMTVLDMFSGGGYYTELLSRVVGPEGRVVAHTNSAYAGFVGEETVSRYAGNRLPNVEHLLAENNELELPADEFDVVMLILSYHDLYYVDEANGWPRIDVARFRAELHKALKPGGVLAVVDHYAAAGWPRETGDTLHRIDPEIVISELEADGFVLESSADFLRNMEDDHSKPVFNPEVRGKTDRFVLKFHKTGTANR